jgi:hypothetical protein
MKWPNVEFPSYSLTNIGTYNPLASTVLELADFTWPDGSKETPSDRFTEDHECPFDDDDVTSSKFGVMIGMITCFTLLAIMIVTSLFIWRKYWNFNVIPLNYRAPISQSDLQQVVTMGLEFVQSMSLGPSIKSLNYTLWYLGMMCQVDLSNVIDMKEGTFWVLINILL